MVCSSVTGAGGAEGHPSAASLAASQQAPAGRSCCWLRPAPGWAERLTLSRADQQLSTSWIWSTVHDCIVLNPSMLAALGVIQSPFNTFFSASTFGFLKNITKITD